MSETKPVVQLSKSGEVIKVFESQAQAAKETGISAKGIRDTLNGIQKTSGGFLWKYAEENVAPAVKDAVETVVEAVKENVNIIPVETIDEVLKIAFTLDKTYEKQPAAKEPKSSKKSGKKGEKGEKSDKSDKMTTETVSV